MRFNNVEVERAYSDYLDSLEDWPPPAQSLSAELAGGGGGTPELDASMRTSKSEMLNS